MSELSNSSEKPTQLSNVEVLCVDLNGTLLHTDTLIELFFAAIRCSPFVLLQSLLWLVKGKARFKHELSRRAHLVAARLPYNEALLSYLREQKAAGRTLVLTTASPLTIAEAVARHVGLFDEIIASNETENLRGHAKARRLIERFGEGKFVYAGNDASDLPVWRVAARAIVVSSAPSLPGRVRSKIEATFPARKGHRLSLLIQAIRVHQWVKNLLVFVPVATANALGNASVVLTACLVWTCFSLMASGVYLFNDLFDLDADRQHERKRNRPFASGRLPLTWGVLLGCGLILLSLLIGFLTSPSLFAVFLGYVVLTSAYSIWLKTKPLIDVFTLAALYTLRIVAGGIGTGFTPSVWLLSFSSFLFLSLAFLKRLTEVVRLKGAEIQEIAGRGYSTAEEIPLIVMGIASSFTSTIVLALYVESSRASTIYMIPEAIWGLVPLSLFWQCRLWLSAWHGCVDDDPIVYAVKDRVSRAVCAAAIICYLIAVVF